LENVLFEPVKSLRNVRFQACKKVKNSI